MVIDGTPGKVCKNTAGEESSTSITFEKAIECLLTIAGVLMNFE
jgi:hypothetical protein